MYETRPLLRLQSVSILTVLIVGSAWPQSPTSPPTALWRDLGAGLQISRVKSGEDGIDLAAEALFRITLGGAAAEGREKGRLEPRDFESAEVSTTERGTRTVWRRADGASFTIETRDDLVPGSLALFAELTWGMTAKAPKAQVESLELRFRLPPMGSPADDLLCLPQWSGIVQADPAAELALHPSRLEHPGTASMPWTYFYDDASRSGLFLRAGDLQGRAKAFEFKGDNGDVLVSLVLHPDPRSAEEGVGFRSPYAVLIRHMSGEWWDACQWYARRLEAEAHPGRSRGPRSEAVPAGRFSPLLDDLDVLYVGSGMHGNMDFALHAEQCRRLRDFFGTTRMVMLGYTWHGNPMGEVWPEILPPNPTAASGLAAIRALGLEYALYTLVHNVHEDSTAWRAGPVPLDQLVARDRAGLPYLVELPAGQQPPETTHHYLNFAHPAARRQTVATWTRMRREFPDLAGVYYDALAHERVRDDHNERLPPKERGRGSSAWVSGLRELLVEFTTAWQDESAGGRADFFQISEFVNESLLDSLEMSSVWSFKLNDLRPFMPLVQSVWGRHHLFYGFEPNCPNPHAGLAPILRWQESLIFHHGKVLQLCNVLDPMAPEYLVPEPGEPAFAGRWTSHEQEHFEYLKRLFVDAAPVIRPYRRHGQRLRPLPQSFERSLALQGHRLQILPDPTSPIGFFPVPDTPGVLSSVWRSTAGAAHSIAVLLTNWRLAGEVFTVTLDAADYPWIAGDHPVVQVDPFTGAETPLPPVQNGTWTFPLAVPPRDLVVLVIRDT